jgi:hypothetical protein
MKRTSQLKTTNLNENKSIQVLFHSFYSFVRGTKKLVLFLSLAFISYLSFGQEADTTKKEEGTNKTVTTQDATNSNIQLNDDKTLVVKDAKDTTRIKIGKKTISIIEDPSGTSVKVSDVTEPVVVESDENDEGVSQDEGDENNGDVEKEHKHHHGKHMEGHWSGVSWGLNNFLTKDNSMSLPPEAKFMDLNTSRSWNFNVNFLEHSFGFGTDRIGLVTGMGLAFNNYHFGGNNNVMDSAGITISKEYDPGIKLTKTKLSSTYLNIPLLLEFQFPGTNKSDRAYISVGVIGGVKVGSHTKVEYKDQKDKLRDDFNLSPLRYAYTARIGFKDLNVYGNYYPVALFETGKGPQLYPFDLGLSWTF